MKAPESFTINGKDNFSKNTAPELQKESTQPFKKPDNEKTRGFKYITLSNNMKCMIISDPIADKSSASLEVQVGSLQDPENFPGTAKLLQKMIMKTSKKYSNEKKN